MKSRNEFIARHLGQIKNTKTEDTAEKFNQILSAVLSSDESAKARRFYEESQSVTKTLAQFGLSSLPPEMLHKIIDVEKKYEVIVPLQSMSKLSQMADQVFTLMKLRLSAGLTYALALTAIATIVFYVISSKVLTQFEEIFSSFGADLPALTNLAISWNNSFFPPVAFVVVLLCFIAFVLVQAKNIQLRHPNKSLRNLPFLSKIFDFLDAFSYLTEVKLLASAGLTMPQIIQAGFAPPTALSKMLQYAEAELSMATKLASFETEIDYQIEALALKAENIVISATRGLIGAVMTLVIAFVGFILIASYLPIFQLGSAI